MLLKTIGDLLDRVLQKQPAYTRLNHLEADVWHAINQQAASQTARPAMFNTQQLAYASLVLLVISSFSLSQISFQPNVHQNTLGLEVFSPQDPLLLTTILNSKGNRIS